MIAAEVGFGVGLLVGAIAAVVASIEIINRPPPKRERPIISAIGAGRARTTGEEDLFEAIDRRLL